MKPVLWVATNTGSSDFSSVMGVSWVFSNSYACSWLGGGESTCFREWHSIHDGRLYAAIFCNVSWKLSARYHCFASRNLFNYHAIIQVYSTDILFQSVLIGTDGWQGYILLIQTSSSIEVLTSESGPTERYENHQENHRQSIKIVYWLRRSLVLVSELVSGWRFLVVLGLVNFLLY
jgi:hypothetical protein